jgi:hypothetical protein
MTYLVERLAVATMLRTRRKRDEALAWVDRDLAVAKTHPLQERLVSASASGDNLSARSGGNPHQYWRVTGSPGENVVAATPGRSARRVRPPP